MTAKSYPEWSTNADGTRTTFGTFDAHGAFTPSETATTTITETQLAIFESNPGAGIPSVDVAIRTAFGRNAELPDAPTPAPVVATPVPTPAPAPIADPTPAPEPTPAPPVVPVAALPENHVAVHVDRITEAKDMLHKIEHGFLIGWTEVETFLKKLV